MEFKVDFLETAKEHRSADKSLGKVWQCGCVACINVKERSIEALEALKWYVENDDVDLGDPENKFWIEGKQRAEKILGIEENKDEGKFKWNVR